MVPEEILPEVISPQETPPSLKLALNWLFTPLLTTKSQREKVVFGVADRLVPVVWYCVFPSNTATRVPKLTVACAATNAELAADAANPPAVPAAAVATAAAAIASIVESAWLPLSPLSPVSPLSPWTSPKFKTGFADVPVKFAVAEFPAVKVVTVPIVNDGDIPFCPVGPWFPVRPVRPVRPVKPIGPCCPVDPWGPVSPFCKVKLSIGFDWVPVIVAFVLSPVFTVPIVKLGEIPSEPFKPGRPVWPVWPTGPSTPVTPFVWKMRVILEAPQTEPALVVTWILTASPNAKETFVVIFFNNVPIGIFIVLTIPEPALFAPSSNLIIDTIGAVPDGAVVVCKQTDINVQAGVKIPILYCGSNEPPNWKKPLLVVVLRSAISP